MTLDWFIKRRCVELFVCVFRSSAVRDDALCACALSRVNKERDTEVSIGQGYYMSTRVK